MKIIQAYKKLYIGLYFCFILSILAAFYPLELFESYSLIDSKSVKSIVEQLAVRQKDKLNKSGAGTFGLRINEHVKYELPIPSSSSSFSSGSNSVELSLPVNAVTSVPIRKSVYRSDSAEISSTVESSINSIDNKNQTGGVKISGDLILNSNKYAFKMSTSRGLVDVLISGRNNGSFSLSFIRSFEKKAVEKIPFLAIFSKINIIIFMCLLLALRLLPLYFYNFSSRAVNEKNIEKIIINLPLFILGLSWTAGFIKLAMNLTGCYIVLETLPVLISTLFLVSFIMFAAFASLLTMGFTQEYINKYIAAPFFENYEPYGIRYGSSINLSMRFFIIIFSIGMAPTLIGLYLQFSFNSGILSGLSSLTNMLDNFDILVPMLITSFFAIYFIFMQIASMLSFRKNIIIPVNNLIQRMKLVAKGDFNCKTRVLYVDEIGQLKGHFNSMLDGLVERDKIKDTFGRFMSFEIAEKLLKEKKVDFSGEEIEATILFSDIRDFTPLSEKLSAPELVEFLNIYFSFVVKPIHDNGGVVNKFVGDAVMAVFTPIFGNINHEESAVAAAVKMKAALAEFNSLNKYPVIKSGIGIHRGKLVAGNIGTKERMEYTFIGDTVNIASRIESETKNMKTDILMSEDIINNINKENFKEFNFFKTNPVLMKGKSLPMTLYGITKA